MAGQRTTTIAAVAAVVAAVVLAVPARAGVETVAPDDERIRLVIDDTPSPPRSYVRQTGRTFVCDIASWDGDAMYGQVAYCKVLGDSFWRSSFVDIDLLFDEFFALKDFLMAPPEAEREIMTTIGEVTLYGFDIDARPDRGHQCLALVQGYNRAASGFRELLVGYACVDDGGLDDAMTDDILGGLSVEGSFASLLR